MEDNLWYMIFGMLVGLTISIQVPAIDWLPWWPYCALALIAWAIVSAIVRWCKHGRKAD